MLKNTLAHSIFEGKRTVGLIHDKYSYAYKLRNLVTSKLRQKITKILTTPNLKPSIPITYYLRNFCLKRVSQICILTTSGSGSLGRQACRRNRATGSALSSSREASMVRSPHAAVLASRLFDFSHGLRHSEPVNLRDQNNVEPRREEKFMFRFYSKSTKLFFVQWQIFVFLVLQNFGSRIYNPFVSLWTFINRFL